MVNNELGDLQTPPSFTDSVVRFLAELGCDPEIIIEPTFGTGNFILSSLHFFSNVQKIVGVEIQKSYHQTLESTLRKTLCEKYDDVVQLYHRNIFDMPPDVFESLRDENVLIIGNPPWVTTSFLGTVNSTNAPRKSSSAVDGSGIEKLTGRSNFDIAESIITFLINSFNNTNTTIAMLCKTSVNKKLLFNAPKYSWNIESWRSLIFSRKVFSINVDACLVVIQLRRTPGATLKSYVTKWEDYNLPENEKKKYPLGKKMGWVRHARRKYFVSDLDSYQEVAFLEKTGISKKWRQGVKHDLSRVLVLKEVPGKEGLYINGLKETVELEDEVLFPLLRGSQVKNFPDVGECTYLLLPQLSLQEDPEERLKQFPMALRYIEEHSEWFSSRKSKVYRRKYSIFGIGEYAMLPYKIAIAGLYKTPHFSLISPFRGKPVLLDDTCYYLGFDEIQTARRYMQALQKREAIQFLRSISFQTDKRPYKASILNRLDIEKLL